MDMKATKEMVEMNHFFLTFQMITGTTFAEYASLNVIPGFSFIVFTFT